jgi:hypothetical protein
MFAFYHPYLDVLNGGAPTPAAKLASGPPAVMKAYQARESGIAGPANASRPQRYGSSGPASTAFGGQDGHSRRPRD